MNLIIILFLICLSSVLDGEKRASFIIKALIDRKSYSIPLKTKFILKCSSSKFGSSKIQNADDLNDEQSADDHPELIVINNLEQTKKLVNYFSKLNEKTSRIDHIGWNKTSLDRVYKVQKSSKDKIKDKKFDKMYENLYVSGKGFFQPNEDVKMFGEGQSCLLFTGFSKKDESIYSCFYKPKFDWFGLFNMFDFSSWKDLVKSSDSDELKQLIDSNDQADSNENFKNFEQLINNENLKDLNNNMPFIEKLLYLTCTYTWPFNQECYLVKQFKLTLEEDTNEDKNQKDYWTNLNSHDRFKFKKLLKELMSYCHHSSLPSKLQQNYKNQLKNDQSKKRKDTHSRESKDLHRQDGTKDGSKDRTKDGTKDRSKDNSKDSSKDNSKVHQGKGRHSQDQQPGLINEFLKHLFNDLFISVFCDLICNILSNSFNFLFGDLFNSVFDGLFISTISELSNDLMKELIDPFKDFNLFHIIYILLFILIYFSFKNDKKKIKSKKFHDEDGSNSQIDSERDSQKDSSTNIKIDAYIDAQIDNDENSKSHKNDSKFDLLSRRTNRTGKKNRDRNLKLNIEANVTNKTRAKRDITRKDALRMDIFRRNPLRRDAFRRNSFRRDSYRRDASKGSTFKDVLDHNLTKSRSNEANSRKNLFKKDTSESSNFENDDITKPMAIISMPKRNDDDDYAEKFKSLLKARNKLGELIKIPINKDKFKDKKNSQDNDLLEDVKRVYATDHEITDHKIIDHETTDHKITGHETTDQNLEFKGEIIISKLGEVSYLGQFLFNLPKELEEKPLHLILDTTDSNDLNELTANEGLNNVNNSNLIEASFSDDLGLEAINKQDNN